MIEKKIERRSKEMFMNIFKNVHEKLPIVHCITNYVTVNDVANIILASGASPIMADDIDEVSDISSICNSLVLNIGTLNSRTIESMVESGKSANKLGHPVVLDPVGVGASKLRMNTTMGLLREVEFSVIRGNASEIKAIVNQTKTTGGVDVSLEDVINEDNINEYIKIGKIASKINMISMASMANSENMGNTGNTEDIAYNSSKANKTDKANGAIDANNTNNTVVAITGPIDIVTNGEKTYLIRNGHKNMGKITGTGCMLSGLIGGYIGANPDDILESTAIAVAAMGLCGELANQHSVKKGLGTGTLRTYLIDFMSNLDEKTLLGGIKIESR